MKVIVNADDYGRCESRNQAIDYSMMNNYCTQTSLMVNMGKDTDKAAELSKLHGYSDRVVLHLNPTLGEPLTQDVLTTAFCRGSQFRFRCTGDVYRTLILDWFNVSAIRSECRAQIEKYLDMGFTLKHLDSHNWVHMHLPVWNALKPLLDEYGFSSIRPMRPNLMKTERFKYRIYYMIFYHIFFKDNQFLKNNYASGLEEFRELKSFNEEIYEIFTHPDIVNGVVMDTTMSYKGNPQKKMEEVSANLKDLEKLNTYGDIMYE